MKIKITRVLKFSFGMIPLISSYMNVSEAATTPAIYGVKIQNITATSAVVSWGTTVNMTGKVAYGLNTTYSTGSKYSGSYATYRQLSLSGLQPNTVYHYKLSDTDSSGHLIQSGDYTFTTASPSIYGVKVQNITATSAVVSWGTTANMTAKIAYGVDTNYSTGSQYSGSYNSYRQLSLSGLQPNTVYHYKLSDTDSSGHLIQSGDYTFTTASPSIYGVKVQNITATSAVVSWGTTANMTAKIAYGVDTNYSTGSQYSGSYNSYRQLSLSGLQPNTVYHYKLSDTDSSGHLIQSGDYTFSTIPPAIYGVKVQNITATTAVVSWGTTVNMSSKVTYGLDTNYSAGSKYSGSYDS